MILQIFRVYLPKACIHTAMAFRHLKNLKDLLTLAISNYPGFLDWGRGRSMTWSLSHWLFQTNSHGKHPRPIPSPSSTFFGPTSLPQPIFVVFQAPLLQVTTSTNLSFVTCILFLNENCICQTRQPSLFQHTFVSQFDPRTLKQSRKDASFPTPSSRFQRNSCRRYLYTNKIEIQRNISTPKRCSKKKIILLYFDQDVQSTCKWRSKYEQPCIDRLEKRRLFGA